jgi:hypothetical protein
LPDESNQSAERRTRVSRRNLFPGLATGVCLICLAASAAPFSFFEPFDAPPLAPGTVDSGHGLGDWEDGFVDGDNGWLLVETPGSGNSFGQRDASGLTPGDHFDQILNARTRNGAAADAIRDLSATPLTSGTITFDISNVLPGLGTPVFQLRLANGSGTVDGLILRFGELDAADNNKFDVDQADAFGTFVATVADSSTTTTTAAPLAWNAVLGNTAAGNYVGLQVDFSTVSGTASVVLTTTDHVGASSSTAPVALNFVNVLPLGVERVSLQMLAPGNAHASGGLTYLDNYSITGMHESGGQDVVIVSGTGPVPSIVKGGGVDTAEAADELADYLSRVSGRTIEVLSSPVGTGVVIHVGNDAFAQAHAPGISALHADGFIMKHVEDAGVDHVILGGNLDRASLWAVEQFLREYCGVRWLFPDSVYGEVVPDMPTVSMEANLNAVHEPDYTSRSNFAMHNFYPSGRHLRGRPFGSQHGTHAIQYIFNNGSYSGEVFDQHPEWFAWFDGQRNWWEHGNGWQICNANPETVTHAVQYCLDFFATHPDADTVSIGQNDGNGFCTDALSVNLKNSVSPSYTESEMWWLWVNQVAAQVGQVYPGKWVEALAYSWASEPPRFALEPNVAVTKTFVLDSEIAQAEAWLAPPAQCQSVNIYTYTWGAFHIGFRHYPAALRDFLRWGRDTLGSTAHVTECGGDWTFDGPKYYAAQIFQWDADADPDAVMEEFCDASYGTASADMKAFWDRLEAVWERRGPVPLGTTNTRLLFYQWVGWAAQCYIGPDDEFRSYLPDDVTFLDTCISNAVAQAAADSAGVQYRVARMEEAWAFFRTHIQSKLYLDNPPSTVVNSDATRDAVLALATDIADLQRDRELNWNRMSTHPNINPRLTNPSRFKRGWLTAYTLYGNEQGLPDEACTSISDYLVGTAGTSSAIQYWAAFDETNSLHEAARSQVYLLNNPVRPNLLVNGDFETGSLSGWTSESTTGIAAGGSHGGTYSARLLNGPCFGGSTISQSVPVSLREQYRLILWGKHVSTPPSDVSSTEATIRFFSGGVLLDDEPAIRVTFPSDSPADGWIRLRTTATAPVGADTAEIAVKSKNFSELRIDDVVFEKIKDAGGIPVVDGLLIDFFDGASLDASKWSQISGSGTEPPRTGNGWLIYDSPSMYDLVAYPKFDDLLEYTGADRYRLRMRMRLLPGGDAARLVAFGIMTGTGPLSTGSTGLLYYHYFDFNSSGQALLSCFNFQGGSSSGSSGGALPVTNPLTDVWYTFYFDPVFITVYASDSGYQEAPANQVAQYAHGITDLTAQGPVYFKIQNQESYEVDEIQLFRPSIYGATPYDSWIASFGLLGADAAFAHDMDGDGGENGYEWGTGTIPIDPFSIEPLSIKRSGPSFHLAFTRNVDATDVTLRLRGSDDLDDPGGWGDVASHASGAWTPSEAATESDAGNPVNVEVSDEGAGSNSRFYLLEVSRP